MRGGRRAPAVAGLALLALAASGCAPRLAAADRGALLDRLLAPPTRAEVASVTAQWDADRVEARNVRVELEKRERDGRRTLVVSHVVDGHRHVGAIRIPAGVAGRRLPVVVVAHGGQTGASGVHLADRGPFATSWIQVAPSYRSETFYLTPLRGWDSEGPPSPWDGDVDDAMGLLRAALAVVPEADSGRVGVWGHSRGGGVALLMGARDPLVRAVVAVAAPTDFFLPEVRRLADRALRIPFSRLPGANVLANRILFGLRDGRVSLPLARQELVRRSAARFVDRLPPTQIHHGEADGHVAVAHAERLAEAARQAGAPVQVFTYPGGGHRTRTLPGAAARATAFLQRTVADPPRAPFVGSGCG